MQQFTQKYAIIQLLEDTPEGAEFFWKDWPLHVTIIDVFAIDWNVPTIVQKLQGALDRSAPATSAVINREFFGPEKNIEVTVLEKTPGLIKLHHSIAEALGQGNFRMNNPQYAYDGFLPHSSVQQHAHLNIGDVVTFTAVTLIDMFPNKDPHQRKVLKTIKIRANRTNLLG